MIVLVGTTGIVAYENFPREQEFSYEIYAKEIDFKIQKDHIVNMNKVKEVKKLMNENIDGKEYILHKYDCTEFSNNLVISLKKAGYKAQCTAGNNWDFEYTNHTWTSVWINGKRFEIESTTGEFINPKEYETYEVYWENKCW